MTLSDQALSCIMMALQKSLMEQSDIVPVLRSFELRVDDNGVLFVENSSLQMAVPSSDIVLPE